MLGQLIVHTAELIEAEGRLARRGVFRLVMASAMLLAAALTLVAAVLSLGAAVLLALMAGGLTPPIAWLLVGLILLVLGIIGVAAARFLIASRK